MPCEAGAQHEGIAIRPCVDAEIDGGPAFPVNGHAELDPVQSETLHVGEELAGRGKRIRSDGPEGDRRGAARGRWAMR